MRRWKRKLERMRRRRSRGPSKALRALTSGALSLPGLAGNAGAQEQPDRVRADYSFSLYREDDMDRSKVASGSTQRYEIETHQVRVGAPIGDRFDVAVDFMYETMSGATPYYITPDEDGTPLQVMTGATVEETRYDVFGKGSFQLDQARVGAGGGISLENDYFAWNGAVDGEHYFHDKNTVLGGGLGFSIDTIEPTGGGTEGRVVEEDKQSYSGFVGVTQLLGRSASINSTLNYQYSTGFLSDPYKKVVIVPANLGLAEPVPDSRPDQRHQVSWLTRYRHHFDAINATFHTDYRFYLDDWKIMSHTAEVAWYQGLWRYLSVIPSFRYYSQSQASFYAPYFDYEPKSGHWSSDYRLSPYGALAWRIKAETRFSTWMLRWIGAVTYERYMSSADFALGRVKTENPGLVSFNMLSFSLTGRF